MNHLKKMRRGIERLFDLKEKRELFQKRRSDPDSYPQFRFFDIQEHFENYLKRNGWRHRSSKLEDVKYTDLSCFGESARIDFIQWHGCQDSYVIHSRYSKADTILDHRMNVRVSTAGSNFSERIIVILEGIEPEISQLETKLKNDSLKYKPRIRWI